MGDLLEKVREFAMHSYTKEEAQNHFKWTVSDITVKTTQSDESHIFIRFENGYMLLIKYFLNLDPTETDDTSEFVLGISTDLRSRIKYNIHYANYIHGQGYIRLKIAEMKNRVQDLLLQEFYVPTLKVIYRPIIQQFKGFYSRDFFGVDVDCTSAEIYYAPVRSRSEHKAARIGDVIGRLSELDLLLKDPQIRHDLAEMDLQLSFLPSVMCSGL
ncbi:Uncharacterised protein [uncultured archaeon]|nr:Uncharacterised protein [uncultured archaeon]